MGKNEISCNDVVLGDTMDFEVNVSAERCEPTSQYPHTVVLKPVGLNQTLK